MKKSSLLLLIAALCCVLVACAQSPNALHRSVYSHLPENVGLFGYSPVSYFEEGIAEQGSSAYQYAFNGKVYYFTSLAQVETFKENPRQYRPRYGEYCPYSLALGRRVAIDPTNFKIHDGKLLLFHNKIELDTVDVPVQRDVFERADKEFKLLEF